MKVDPILKSLTLENKAGNVALHTFLEIYKCYSYLKKAETPSPSTKEPYRTSVSNQDRNLNQDAYLKLSTGTDSTTDCEDALNLESLNHSHSESRLRRNE